MQSTVSNTLLQMVLAHIFITQGQHGLFPLTQSWMLLNIQQWREVCFDLGWLMGIMLPKFPHGIPLLITEPSPPVRAEEVDRTLQRQDSGVESALLYAKAWSKYTKELLAWVEKRLSVGELG